MKDRLRAGVMVLWDGYFCHDAPQPCFLSTLDQTLTCAICVSNVCDASMALSELCVRKLSHFSFRASRFIFAFVLPTGVTTWSVEPGSFCYCIPSFYQHASTQHDPKVLLLHQVQRLVLDMLYEFQRLWNSWKPHWPGCPCLFCSSFIFTGGSRQSI